MIRIVSEGGTGAGTKFLDAKTGQDLNEILAIAFGGTIEIDQMVTGQFKLVMIETDVTAEKVDFLTKHPISKHFEPVASITFRDGWQIDFPEGGAPRVRQVTPTGDK